MTSFPDLTPHRDVVRWEPTPKARYFEAYMELRLLLAKARQELLLIKERPVVIAASPNCYNDMGWVEWRAVRTGSFLAESQDFTSRWNDYNSSLRKKSKSGAKAKEVLEALEIANWREIFKSAFHVNWDDQSIAVVILEKEAYLVFSASNNTDEQFVFHISDGGDLVYLAECTTGIEDTIAQDPPISPARRQ